MASLGHISLDGSKPVLSEAEEFNANSTKHKAMSYKRLKEKEQKLTEEIEALIAQAKRCAKKEDQGNPRENRLRASGRPEIQTRTAG